MSIEAVQQFRAEVPNPVTLTVGAQWGDEGKGKVVNELATEKDTVIRYQGGNNAGHTVKEEGVEGAPTSEPLEFKFHTLPSAMGTGAECVISEGVVVNPISTAAEIKEISRRVDVTDSNLFISSRAQLIMPWHIDRDRLREESASSGAKIGTTLKGIGPAFEDKVGRTGLVVGDLYRSDFEERFDRALLLQERYMKGMDREAFEQTILEASHANDTGEQLRALALQAVMSRYYDRDQILESLRDAKETLKPFVTNTFKVIWDRYLSKRSIIGEGAQGALLDVDLGFRPFVTSSNTGYAGFVKTTGINPGDIFSLGLAKAYTSRVGGGALPTEQPKGTKIGDHLLTVGQEIGTTTGRERRSGWFDALVTRHGLQRVAFARKVGIMKLDVLDGLDEVLICSAYKKDGEIFEDIPTTDASFLEGVEPVYEVFPGWKNTKGIEHFEDFPIEAQRYLKRIEELMGIPVALVSTGAIRGQTIYRAT